MMSSKKYYIYRCQGDSKWKVESGFVRENKLHFKKREEDLLPHIKNYFIDKNKFLKENLKTDDDLLLLGEMQHHGQLTPLIDFTDDVLVALWFAVSYFEKFKFTEMSDEDTNEELGRFNFFI